MKITFKRVTTGQVDAVDSEGQVVASWTKSTAELRRNPFASRYDMHRFTKGDDVEYVNTYAERGDARAILAAIEQQLPAAFTQAKWALPALSLRTDKVDNFAIFEFVKGLAEGGAAWFGNTPKPVIAAVKRAQKNLMFNV